MKKLELDVIIPIFNEMDLIEKSLQRLLKVKFPECISNVNICLVDDCSEDQSFNIVQTFIDKNKLQNIKIYKHEKNKGKGAAVRYGISKTSGDIIIIQDADLELIPDDIPAMINALTSLDVHFVNGSRYLPGISRPLSSYKRYLANRFMTWLTSLLINVKLTDIACGYKLFYRELYNELDIKENRFGFEAEIIIKAIRYRKNNITEVPVNYFPRNKGEGKKIRSIDGLKILFTILKYSFKVKTNEG